MSEIEVERVRAVRTHTGSMDPNLVVVTITIADGASHYYEFTRAEFKALADQWQRDALLMADAAGSA